MIAAPPDLHGHAGFRGADAAGACRPGHEIAAVYTRAPKPAGRGMKLRADSGRARGAAARHSGFHADDAEDAEAARGDSRARRRCRRGRRLRHDPAEADPRCAAARLLQSARLAVAALARRRADQPRHHGRRCRDRRDGDEDGRRPRHRRRSRWPSASPIGPMHDRRRSARRAGAARRRSDGAGDRPRWNAARCN